MRKREPGHDVALEGYVLMMDRMTHPYQIPYGIIVPKTMDGLLVPVAASTTHIAFGSIRLEPTWMTLGQAAGVAAHFAIRDHVPIRSIPIDELQQELIREGQVLTYFKDIDPSDPAYAGLQYFGTKGFFRDYLARSRDKLDRATAREWLRLISPQKSGAQAGSGLTERGSRDEFVDRSGHLGAPFGGFHDGANRACAMTIGWL